MIPPTRSSRPPSIMVLPAKLPAKSLILPSASNQVYSNFLLFWVSSLRIVRSPFPWLDFELIKPRLS